LRIEDTDRKRSSEAALKAIMDGLSWLGLDWEGGAVSQYSRASAHAEAAQKLLAEGKAYPCYCSPEELAEMRDTAKKEGRSMRYDGRWRGRDPSKAPKNVSPAIRLKAPRDGETHIKDLVQGEVTVANKQLDDMVLLRADGTPTYMLAVVVDDHEMGVTHVIRGDDHLTNAFRQTQLYVALGWETPEFAHIPLIHGADGAKLSKRHGALGVDAYREMGFLPEALRNYLLRLGWGHGDDEIISTEQAVQWFDLDGAGKSPSRFDMDKLTNLNGHYLRASANEDLCALVLPKLSETPLSNAVRERLLKGMPTLKNRAKTLVELTENAAFYVRERPLPLNDRAKKILDADALDRLRAIHHPLAGLDAWSVEAIEDAIRRFADAQEIKLGAIAQPLRAALTGAGVSPGVFEVMEALGRGESLARIEDAFNMKNQ
ncbi:MAG TPA: glutamate--tRNA ligase, partial [Rhodospirillales bacterium]|nr:glutamate--tRNA ligase [Rhodospirillales bacterium]